MNTKQKVALVAGILLFIIPVTVYTINIKMRPAPSETNSSIDSVLALPWISNVNCSPPCWEGISPGMSAIDALNILKQKQNVKSTQLHHDIGNERGEIDWVWEDGTEGGRIFYSGPSFYEGYIYAIVPYFECCVELDSIISLLGFPDYAYTKEIKVTTENTNQTYFTYTLLWSHKGYAVKGFPKSGTQIKENFQVDTMIFTEPSIDGFLSYEGNSGKNLIPWHGYDDALEYLVP